MARDLDRLVPDPDLALPEGSEPGLNAIDPRLTAITDLAERQKYDEAADLTEALLDEQVYDIRPLSVYLFEVFLEDGFTRLARVFDVLGQLRDSPLVGPGRRRDDHFQRRIAWLFSSIGDSLEFHQKKRSAEWERWLAAASVSDLDDAIDAAQRALQQLPATSARPGLVSLDPARPAIRGSSAEPRYDRVLDQLRDVREQLRHAAAPPPSVVAPSIPGPTAPAAPPVGSPAVALPDAPPELTRQRLELVVAHPFIELLRKLQAFEQLIENKQFEKAALVADDIQTALDHFDPRAHFPEVFGRFSSQLSRNIQILSSHWMNRDSDAWRALAQFYRVDLKSFVND